MIIKPFDFSKVRRWYAWYPVEVKTGEIVWLEYVSCAYIEDAFGDYKRIYSLLEESEDKK
jgi:hypothetical protein